MERHYVIQLSVYINIYTWSVNFGYKSSLTFRTNESFKEITIPNMLFPYLIRPILSKMTWKWTQNDLNWTFCVLFLCEQKWRKKFIWIHFYVIFDKIKKNWSSIWSYLFVIFEEKDLFCKKLSNHLKHMVTSLFMWPEITWNFMTFQSRWIFWTI